jgi:hypothetical protein
VPYLRGHAYWRLDEPVRNMQAWKAVQKAIAASLKTDETVVNPSRIMRVAGTVSWPPERKRMKGYIPELVTMRTTVLDRPRSRAVRTPDACLPRSLNVQTPYRM